CAEAMSRDTSPDSALWASASDAWGTECGRKDTAVGVFRRRENAEQRYDLRLSPARACSRETGGSGTREYALGLGDRANGGSTSQNPPPHECKNELCSERSCDAGVHPASAFEDGSQ